MSEAEFDSLLSGQADSSAAPRDQVQTPFGTEEVPGPLVTPEDAAPPLTDEEFQAMQESMVTGSEVSEDLGVLPEPDLSGTALRLLRPDEVPMVGTHYVIWGDPPMPYPVLVGVYAVTENAHVLLASGATEIRQERAEAYSRWRYKGYLCGQVDGL